MKKYLVFAAAAVLGLVACNKNPEVVTPSEGKKVDVTVSIQGAPSMTKATGTTYANESKVNNLQVFVFNGEQLEGHNSVNEKLQAVVAATAGQRSIWAIVNAPVDLYSTLGGDAMTRSALVSAATALSQNALDSFVMTGSVDQEVVDGGNVAIDVRRIVSRVSVGKISCEPKEYLDNFRIQLNGIYMINVTGDTAYGSDGNPSLWVNQMGHNDAAYDVLLADMFDTEAVEVTPNAPHEVEHAFYPYPNVIGDPSHADSWNPRNSMLVIEATAVFDDGTTQHGWYPIDLPALERNKTYIIDEVKISRYPGDKPYEPIATGETQVTITVHDWELGLNLGNITI